MTVNWIDFASAIQPHQRFLLISHVRPDCDALGSELGMAGILEALGKDVRIVNGDVTPPNLAFIDPENRIEVLGQGVTLEDLQDIDAIMILDTSAWGQLGPMGDVIRSLDVPKMVLPYPVPAGARRLASRKSVGWDRCRFLRQSCQCRTLFSSPGCQ